jgi:hypothetical protein
MRRHSCYRAVTYSHHGNLRPFRIVATRQGKRIGGSADRRPGSQPAFRQGYIDQEVFTRLMALCKRRDAHTPTRRYVSPGRREPDANIHFSAGPDVHSGHSPLSVRSLEPTGCICPHSFGAKLREIPSFESDLADGWDVSS